MLVDVGDTRLHVTERGGGRARAVRPARRPRARPHDVRLPPRRARRSLPAAARRRARHGPLRARRRRRPGTLPTTPPTSRRWPARSGSSATPSSATPSGRSSRCSTRSTSPGARPRTIVSSGIPDARFLAHVEAELAAFEPVELREQVQRSWAREAACAHAGGRRARCSPTSCPFHFADPRDPRIDELRAAMGDAVYGPDVLRAAATGLRRDRRRGPPRRRRPPGARARRAPRPHLLGAGRRGDRGRLPDAELVVFEHSGHMTYVEENDAYLAAVRDFLERRAPAEPQPPARTSAAAASACSSWSRTRSRPCAQNAGSSRSRPAIAASSSGLREPPAASSSR